METITYKLDHFEGPLDLLLHLIEKNKVMIFTISPLWRSQPSIWNMCETWNGKT